MTPPSDPPAPWGSCRFCGVAVPAGATRCGICGADGPVPAGRMPGAPRSVRRRVRLTSALRVLIVVVVVVGLTYTIVGAVLSGPPNVPDPLSTSGSHVIPVAGVWVLSGEITGGDYVVGNFSTIDPVGLSVVVSVYNESQWAVRSGGGDATPTYALPAEASARIIFSAPYTDTYYFVFANPYPAASELNVTAYVVTQYESNVGDDGLG